VYQNEDICLLDDTLSAVDANVGESIFNNCIRGLLADKTRILVTQQYQYLNRCDYILVVRNGAIVEQGTYEQLAAQPDSEFVRLNSNYEAQVAHAEEKKEAASDAPTAQGEGALMSVEEHQKGSVPWHVYDFFFRRYGIALFILTVVLFSAASICSTAVYYWLSLWTRAKDIVVPSNSSSSSGSGVVIHTGPSTALGLGIFAALIGGTVVLYLAQYLVHSIGTLRVSRGMHDRPLMRLLTSTMATFHTTPVGRIINRFSEDMQIIDDKLSFSVGMLLTYLTMLITTIVAVVMVVPYATPFFLPLVYMYFYIQEWYTYYARELFRLDVIARSPLYSRFSETLQGLDTINCFHQRRRFVAEVERKLNHQQRAFYAIQVTNGWLGVRISEVAMLCIVLVALICCLDRDNHPSGELAFALLSGSNFFWLLPALVTTVADVKLNMVSAQRLVHIHNLPQEGPLEDRDAPVVPPPGWPGAGRVEFRNYMLQYRPELPPAMSDMSLVINPGEKVGIVGRTGAGKSSLIVALFRLCEAAAGKVLVDDVDISKVSLHTLRSRLCVIPQDPVLFRGTLRKNLDVLDRYSEQEMLAVLDAVNLRESVLSKPNGLECEVTESGQNFSVGERQLVCLARGLLRRANVIVLDEATANIDLATEERIHHVLFERCKGATMMFIAHRTHTIMKCDRVLMLERGQVVAFGTPRELMHKSEAFAALIKHSGLKDEQRGSTMIPVPAPAPTPPSIPTTTTTLVEVDASQPGTSERP
jgi:ABC-type multidrug transport system fused ATPase/permease subunit